MSERQAEAFQYRFSHSSVVGVIVLSLFVLLWVGLDCMSSGLFCNQVFHLLAPIFFFFVCVVQLWLSSDRIPPPGRYTLPEEQLEAATFESRCGLATTLVVRAAAIPDWERFLFLAVVSKCASIFCVRVESLHKRCPVVLCNTHLVWLSTLRANTILTQARHCQILSLVCNCRHTRQ